jgi:hypothetical protein
VSGKAAGFAGGLFFVWAKRGLGGALGAVEFRGEKQIPPGSLRSRVGMTRLTGQQAGAEDAAGRGEADAA